MAPPAVPMPSAPYLTREAKRSVDMHSSRWAASGHRLATMTVMQLPPSASFSAAVSLVCLWAHRFAASGQEQTTGCEWQGALLLGISVSHLCNPSASCEANVQAIAQSPGPFHWHPRATHLKGTCASLRARALTTCSRKVSDLLMAVASRSDWPAAADHGSNPPNQRPPQIVHLIRQLLSA
jgi:hypothetical protein